MKRCDVLSNSTCLSPLGRRIGRFGQLAALLAGGLAVFAFLIPAQGQAGQLPASAFQAYNAANAASIQAGPFALYEVPVNSLHPTQLDVGFAEVNKKVAGFDLLAASALQADLLTDIEPVVIGPGGVLYQTDGHHTFLALADSIYGASNPTVYVNVIANYSNMTMAQFWAAMEAANFVNPLNDGVVETIDPETGAPLPDTLTGMQSDVYRGLEYSILKNKNNILFPTTSNITGAVGSSIPGLDKTNAYYSDFIWAYAYRNANGGLGLPYLSPGDIALATQWNLNPANKTTLPGLGTVSVAQLPGYILPTGGSITISGAISNATLANGVLDGTATGTFTETGGNNASFNGMRGLDLGAVTIGANAPGFVMQLGADNGATVSLTGSNTYTGGTTILAGTLIINGDAALGAATPAGATISPTNVAASVEAANGIIFNSLTEGNGTLQIGATNAAPTYTAASPLVTNRPIAVDGEVANINLNDNAVELTGQIVSLGGGGDGLSNQTGESDITVEDNSTAGNGVLILPASASNPYFYGNWIISSGTLQVSSDAALGNTTGNPASIGEIELNGGILQAGASFTSVRSLFLGGGSTIDTNGDSMNFAGSLTDVQRTLEVTNSATGTTGSVGFGSFIAASTATLSLVGGSTATSTNVDVSVGSGFVRQGNAGLLLQPDTGVLGTSEQVTQTTAPTLTNGIVSPWIIIDSSQAATPPNANSDYTFATYGADGYTAYTSGLASITGATASSVVEQTSNATLTGNAAAYALEVEKGFDITIGSGHTLTIGDGTDPAGLIFNGGSGSGLTGGTLALGGSEGVFFTHGSSTISSVITGTGGLSFNGSGTLTLSAASTDTGPVTVNSGTLTLTAANALADSTSGVMLENVKSHPSAAILQLNASQQFAALNSDGNNSSVNLASGVVLTIGNTTSNLDSTLSSTITESGSATAGALTLDGTGLVDLSGQSKNGLNLASGSSVVVNGGTLRIVANIFKNPNTIVLNGGQLQVAQNGGGVLANPITGTGSLNLIGGILHLTGTSNTYTGGTYMQLGSTLDITTANLPSVNENITDAGGLVDFDQATSGTYTGVISDGQEMGTGPMEQGSLLKDDSSGANGGNVTLAQRQSYSGPTFVEAGTLTLGAVNAIASSSGVTLGRIGGGSIATLALGADNQIATLNDNPGSTTAPSTNTVQLNGHTLTIAPGAGVGGTFLGTISGAGGTLVMAGSGTQVLDGQSTIGTTSVQSGLLAIGDAGTPTASVTGAVTVAPAGALEGTGTIFGALTNAGVLLPGTAAAPGTMTVNGTYTQTASGTLDVIITPSGQGSLLKVVDAGGTAQLAGGLAVAQQGSGFVVGTKYTLVSTTDGLSGAFTSLSSTGSFWIVPTLSYNADDAYLTLAQLPVTTVAVTPNQYATAIALDALFASGTATAQQTAFDELSVSGAQSTLDRLSGQSYTGFESGALATGAAFTNQITNELAMLRRGFSAGGSAAQAAGDSGARVQLAGLSLAPGMLPDHGPQRWGMWVEGYGVTNALGGNSNTGQLNSTIGGTTVGADYEVNPALRLGFAAGYASDDFSVNNSGTQGHTDNAQFALYGDYEIGRAYVAGTIGYTHADGTMTRDVSLPGLPGQAKGSIAGNQAVGRAETGYDFVLPMGMVATPYLAMQFGTYTQNGMTETTGGPVALSVGPASATSVVSELGGRLTASLHLAGLTIATEADLGWAHDYASTSRTITAAFVGAPGTPFTVSGAEPARDQAIVGLGAATAITRRASVFLRYDGALGGSDNSHAVSGGLRIRF